MFRYLILGDGSLKVDTEEPMKMWKTGSPNIRYKFKREEKQNDRERPFDAQRWLGAEHFTITDIATGSENSFPDSSILTYNLDKVGWLGALFHEQRQRDQSVVSLKRIRLGILEEALKEITSPDLTDEDR